ncbi:hypothetical protein AABC73_29250 (plasmid) [Pseudomonas sp. G.S.17]|uniref:hypothetical protein n=1 Tax=Pseudomonas sp. G.S.17 TaxID=3137451 RepID=UPI00311C952C
MKGNEVAALFLKPRLMNRFAELVDLCEQPAVMLDLKRKAAYIAAGVFCPDPA